MRQDTRQNSRRRRNRIRRRRRRNRIRRRRRRNRIRRRTEGARGDFRFIEDPELVRTRVLDVVHQFESGQPRITPAGEEPQKPKYNPGRVGAAIRVKANYFRIKCELEEAIQFDVQIGCGNLEGIEGEVMARLAEAEEWPRGWAFDGNHTLYTAGSIIPAEYREIYLEFARGTRRNIPIKIAKTATIRMDVIEQFIQEQPQVFRLIAIQVLEVALRHAVSMMPGAMLRDRDVFGNMETSDIGHGVEAWIGYHQRVRSCQNGLYLNMDTTCRAFYKPMRVTEFITEILDLEYGRIPGRLDDRQRLIVRSVLKNLTVSNMLNGDRERVVDLADMPAKLQFEDRDYGKVNVAEYYSIKMARHLEFPFLPCLDCSEGNRSFYLPMEMAMVECGQYVRKMMSDQQEAMIELASMSPLAKEEKISSLARQEGNLSRMEKLQDFRLSSVDSEMATLNARILPSPCLAFKKFEGPEHGTDVLYLDTGTGGTWNPGGQRLGFFEGEKLRSWAFVSLVDKDECEGRGENSLWQFIRDLVGQLMEYNVINRRSEAMKINENERERRKKHALLQDPPIVYLAGRDFATGSDEAMKKAKLEYRVPPDIIMFLIPFPDEDMYRAIKTLYDVEYGVASLVFTSKNSGVGSVNPPHDRLGYCFNLALRINAKVGGVNWVLAPEPECILPMVSQSKPYMLLGASVSHPPLGSEIASMAAVVGSIDPAGSKYVSRVTLQQTREEIIADMKTSIKGLLLDFYYRNRMKPESLIMFRYGVPEILFSRVMTSEFTAIREACMEMGDPAAEYSPPITFICVQKKHHSRFFPENQSEAHSTGNIRPGTAGIEGETVRPAHYHVLADESSFGPDALQVMCYWLCFTHCCSTESISIPAPATYAAFAALRGSLIAGDETDDDYLSSVFGLGSLRHPNFRLSQLKMYYV